MNARQQASRNNLPPHKSAKFGRLNAALQAERDAIRDLEDALVETSTRNRALSEIKGSVGNDLVRKYPALNKDGVR